MTFFKQKRRKEIEMKNTLSLEDALILYRRVMEICKSDGLIMCFDEHLFTKADLTYNYIATHLSDIVFIETDEIENSRMYASNFVQIIIGLSMKRDGTNKVEFVYTSEDIVTAVYNSLVWSIDSGYSSAIQDMKKEVTRMMENTSSSLDNI